MDFPLFLNAFLLGCALAMDAFAVSIATGISDNEISKGRVFALSGTFGAFQMLMPLAGWAIVSVSVKLISVVGRAVPWIAAIVLIALGIKMIVGSFGSGGEGTAVRPGVAGALYAGLMTSVDALSIGPSMADLTIVPVLVESLIIGVVTFGICLFGFFAGRKIGEKTGRYSGLVGGIILIIVGIRLFISGVILH